MCVWYTRIWLCYFVYTKLTVKNKCFAGEGQSAGSDINRDEFEAEKQARDEAQVDPSRAIAELELGARAEKSLTEAGITEVGQVFDRLVESEEGLLAIKGFGQKSLSELKKALRKLGYKLSEATEDVNA